MTLAGVCVFWTKTRLLDHQKDHDRRLDLGEFEQASALVGHRLSAREAEAEFAAMDEDGGGFVLFDEFCVWCAQHTHPEARPAPAVRSHSNRSVLTPCVAGSHRCAHKHLGADFEDEDEAAVGHSAHYSAPGSSPSSRGRKPGTKPGSLLRKPKHGRAPSSPVPIPAAKPALAAAPNPSQLAAEIRSAAEAGRVGQILELNRRYAAAAAAAAPGTAAPWEMVVDLADDDGRTALYIACQEGQTAAVEQLAALGADPDAVCSNGVSPLHACQMHGNDETAAAVQRLVDERQARGGRPPPEAPTNKPKAAGPPPSPWPVIAGERVKYVGGYGGETPQKMPAVSEGALWCAVRRTPVRSGCAVSSAKVGQLQPGDIFEAVETATDPSTGLCRLRGAAGWVSSVTPAGADLLRPVAPGTRSPKQQQQKQQPGRRKSPGRASSAGRGRPKSPARATTPKELPRWN